MAEWNPSTSYAPNAEVTYLGLSYRRSFFPSTPTAGTNPKEEMSVDSQGTEIRTWELRAPSVAYPISFNVGYFRIIAPERSDGIYISEPPMGSYPGKFLPEHPYAGSIGGFGSAYGNDGVNGIATEWDQARAASGSIPSAPVAPAEKCGVVMQQFQETEEPSTYGYADTGVRVYQGLTLNTTTGTWFEDFSARPRIFYAFLFFNHPLYFRRVHTITFRITTFTYNTGWTVPDTDPPEIQPATSEGVLSSTVRTVTPTDGNYWARIPTDLTGWIQPANADATYTLPNDEATPGPYDSTDGVDYALVECFVSNVDSND